MWTLRALYADPTRAFSNPKRSVGRSEQTDAQNRERPLLDGPSVAKIALPHEDR